jgi:hypothetical protein
MKTTALLLWVSKANIAGDVAEAGAKSSPYFSLSKLRQFGSDHVFRIQLNIYNSYSYSFIRLSLEVPMYSYPNVVLNAADICNLKVGSPLPALKGIPEVPSLRQCPT